MKKILFVLISVVAITVNSNGQTIDTVKTINNGTVPSIYSAKKLYYEKNYDTLNHLFFEGLKYSACYLGTITYYWPNGKVKNTCKYLIDTTGGLQKLPFSGHCNVPDGEWKSYNETGKLVITMVYDKGKIVKTY
ncbi:MAG: hypothetical protein ACHQF0_08990 [Chitinophagales bacterium]